MTLFKPLFLSFLFVVSTLQYPLEQPSDCLKVYLQVKQDQEAEQLKYYYFGIAQLSPNIVDVIKATYQIEVIALGCMVNEEQICYNQQVDLILKAKTGKDLYGLVEAVMAGFE